MSTNVVYKEEYQTWKKLHVLEESDTFYIVHDRDDPFDGIFSVRKTEVSVSPTFSGRQLASLLKDYYESKSHDTKFLSDNQLKKDAIALGLVTADQVKIKEEGFTS